MSQNQLKPYQQIGVVAAKTARDKLLEAFEEKGIGPSSISAVARDLLNATKIKVQFVKGRPALVAKDGTVVAEAEESGFKYSKPVRDNTTQYNTLKLIMEFFDTMPSKKIDINDERQTRNMVNQLMMAMSKQVTAGEEDLRPQLGEVEAELMGDMVEMGKVAADDGEGLGFEPVPMVPAHEDEGSE